MNPLEHLFIGAGWLLTGLLLVLAVLWAAFTLLDKILKYAGMVGICIQFMRAEFNKYPRSFCARLFWGRKES